MSRMERMSFVLWIACKKVKLQSGLGLRSIAKSMRRQTSSGRCSAVSRAIHKSKTCSFRTGKDLSNDSLVLKIDRRCSASDKGALKKKIAPTATKKERGRKRQCPALCEVCLRPSAISADVTHAVGVADLAPATEHAEASLFAPFAVVVAVLAPEARLFAPFGQLNLFLRL